MKYTFISPPLDLHNLWSPVGILYDTTSSLAYDLNLSHIPTSDHSTYLRSLNMFCQIP